MSKKKTKVIIKKNLKKVLRHKIMPKILGQIKIKIKLKIILMSKKRATSLLKKKEINNKVGLIKTPTIIIVLTKTKTKMFLIETKAISQGNEMTPIKTIISLIITIETITITEIIAMEIIDKEISLIIPTNKTIEIITTKTEKEVKDSIIIIKMKENNSTIETNNQIDKTTEIIFSQITTTKVGKIKSLLIMTTINKLSQITTTKSLLKTHGKKINKTILLKMNKAKT